ncbi:hypothetical protein [Rubinisphaera sp.]|uniref:hypothetical protein n=1 Tax=Rubinisphaera sp. TaxID=2024857 RepID=UPI000C0E5BDF|nr:hypothetical protein [Rubinisphaera sp.]MBV08936.1 hypothetical protein [Rubinisphaera sp.]HCS52254.1 hypothetical protein [Planctomycetaceae bacterium]|tara:strand:- start:3276 stop:4016 length:741 start_codon:yes stop_codon:yes gene_type:complete
MTSIAIVCEAPADFLISSELADRVVLNEVEWLEIGLLDSQRTWIRESNGTELLWKHIKSLARPLGIKIHGHFGGEPGQPDASIARRAILLLRRLFDPDAIMLIRDADNQAERLKGLNQARDHFGDEPKIVIGVADPEREAWVIAGFDPSDETEQKLLESERQNLGFDPRTRSHELTATNDDQAKKSPKRVLKVLTCDSVERENPCWQETELTTLESNGRSNGLCPFLAEVKQHLVPLITGRQDPPA